MSWIFPFKHWDLGFESHWRHGCLFLLLLCLFTTYIIFRVLSKCVAGGWLARETSSDLSPTCSLLYWLMMSWGHVLFTLPVTGPLVYSSSIGSLSWLQFGFCTSQPFSVFHFALHMKTKLIPVITSPVRPRVGTELLSKTCRRVLEFSHPPLWYLSAALSWEIIRSGKLTPDQKLV
jgi:hypothetical protein